MVVLPGWLTELVATMAIYPKVGIVGAMLSCLIDTLIDRPLEDGLISVEAVGTTCALYRRKLFEVYGRFDEELWNLWSDLDFSMRVNASGEWRIVVNPKAVVYHPTSDRDGHTRSLPELYDEEKLFRSMRIMKERWGVEHKRYKELEQKYGGRSQAEG